MESDSAFTEYKRNQIWLTLKRHEAGEDRADREGQGGASRGTGPALHLGGQVGNGVQRWKVQGHAHGPPEPRLQLHHEGAGAGGDHGGEGHWSYGDLQLASPQHNVHGRQKRHRQS